MSADMVANAEYGRYERCHGLNCDVNRDIADDAKLISKTITEWRKAGIVPADMKTSVRIDRFSMGQSLDVKITVPWQALRPLTDDQRWQAQRGAYDELTTESRSFALAPEYADAFVAIEDLQRSLNYDGSEIQTDYFDVKFYGHVSVTSTAGYSGGNIVGRDVWEHTEGWQR